MNSNNFEEKEDRRIRKTKKSLRQALVRLLRYKTLDEITIKELTEEADVHRGTFYHHYRDAYDLKNQVDEEIKAELTDLVQNVKESEIANGPYPLLLRVLLYLEDNREVAQMLANDRGPNSLLATLCNQISERCFSSNLFGEELRYGNQFCAAGLESMMASWIHDGMRMTPKEMAKVMETMLAPVGSSYNSSGRMVYDH